MIHQKVLVSRLLFVDIKSVLMEAKNAQKLYDLSVAVQRLDAELLDIKSKEAVT